MYDSSFGWGVSLGNGRPGSNPVFGGSMLRAGLIGQVRGEQLVEGEMWCRNEYMFWWAAESAGQSLAWYARGKKPLGRGRLGWGPRHSKL